MKQKTSPIRKAVLPVAGFGTRILPASKSIPKEMIPVFNKPALDYVVEEAFQAGIEQIIFVTGRNKAAIEDYFDHAYELEHSLEKKGKIEILKMLRKNIPNPEQISFVRQQSAKGLGHAVCCAEHLIGNEPFAVLLPDVLIDNKPSCLKQMITLYQETGKTNMLAVEYVDYDQVNKYGIIRPETEEKILETHTEKTTLIPISGMVEKPSKETAPSQFAITGRYILQPEIFSLLKKQTKGAGGEIQLTDAMANLMKIQTFHACLYKGKSYDCGDLIGYLEAFAAFALKDEIHGKKARETLKNIL